MQFYGFSCISDFRSQGIGYLWFQKAVRLLSVKGFLRHKPSESNGNTEVFEKCSLNHGKWGNIPKQNDDKFRNHKPCNLCKGNGKRQVKVIDCIQDFFHVPDTRIRFNLFQVVSAPFVSSSKRKGQPFSDCPLKEKYAVSSNHAVADLPALIWYLAHTSACFNEATAHIQISPVGFIVNIVL